MNSRLCRVISSRFYLNNDFKDNTFVFDYSIELLSIRLCRPRNVELIENALDKSGLVIVDWTGNNRQDIQSSEERLLCQSNILNSTLLPPANKNMDELMHWLAT